MTNSFSLNDIDEIARDVAEATFLPGVPQYGRPEFLHSGLLPAGSNSLGVGNEIARVAARRGHVATLRWLAERGVDLSVEVKGHTPIELAVSHGHTDAVLFLKDVPNIDMTQAGSPRTGFWKSLDLPGLAERNDFPKLAILIKVLIDEAKVRSAGVGHDTPTLAPDASDFTAKKFAVRSDASLARKSTSGFDRK